jgi:hypothetical protein
MLYIELHLQVGEDLLPVAFHTGLAVLLGDQAGPHASKGFGSIHQAATAAFDLHKAIPLSNHHHASEEVFVVRLGQAQLLEGGRHLASAAALKLAQTLFAELPGYVAAAAVEAAHPHGHYTLLNLFQGNIRDVCHAVLALRNGIITLLRPIEYNTF